MHHCKISKVLNKHIGNSGKTMTAHAKHTPSSWKLALSNAVGAGDAG